MTSRDFCYWLQGYLEIHGATSNDPALPAVVSPLNPLQVEMIRRHLALVFKHEIDQQAGGDPAELQQIHDGKLNYPPGVRC